MRMAKLTQVSDGTPFFFWPNTVVSIRAGKNSDRTARDGLEASRGKDCSVVEFAGEDDHGWFQELPDEAARIVSDAMNAT